MRRLLALLLAMTMLLSVGVLQSFIKIPKTIRKGSYTFTY